MNDDAIGADAPGRGARTGPDTAAQASPVSLTRRNLAAPSHGALWALALRADERTRLRGLRPSRCGQPLLLQLPRGEPLQPGEWLGSDDGPALVRVEAADEALLVVRAADPLELLRAAYHLGNRHVALQVSATELRLLADPVLAEMLRQRGLHLEEQLAPFLPEGGAYASEGHGHTHGPRTGPEAAHHHGSV
ncbi:MAG: urease accessory protein UreE [Synechococcaceae cyanobacterium ELA739]